MMACRTKLMTICSPPARSRDCAQQLRQERPIAFGAPLGLAKTKRNGRTTAMTQRARRQHTIYSGGVCPCLRGVSADAGVVETTAVLARGRWGAALGTTGAASFRCWTGRRGGHSRFGPPRPPSYEASVDALAEAAVRIARAPEYRMTARGCQEGVRSPALASSSKPAFAQLYRQRQLS